MKIRVIVVISAAHPTTAAETVSLVSSVLVLSGCCKSWSRKRCRMWWGGRMDNDRGTVS